MSTITFRHHESPVFFTADTHFGHALDALVHHRGYLDPNEMTVGMMNKWNTVVPEGATVIHLGDVSFFKRERTQEILAALNGRKYLVPGNHDKGMRFGTTLALQMPPLVEIKVEDGSPEATRIVLCHFPLHSWNRMHYGAWHLHGHSHGSMPGFGRRQDVGWDVFHGPVSFQQLKSLVGDRGIKSFDHHQPKEKHDVAPPVR